MVPPVLANMYKYRQIERLKDINCFNYIKFTSIEIYKDVYGLEHQFLKKVYKQKNTSTKSKGI